MNRKYVPIILSVILIFAASCIPKPEREDFSVGEPEIVLSYDQWKKKGIRWFDTSIFALHDQGQWKWFCGSGRWGQKYGIGPRDHPYDSVVVRNLFVEGIPNAHRVLVPWSEIHNWGNSHWFSNVYLDSTTGYILAFSHHEHMYSFPDYPAYFRTGLSVSKDGGNTFTWCGYIISPDLSYETWLNHWFPEKVSCNMGLANYIVKDGYFYLYYTDYIDQPDPLKVQTERGVAVVRSKVEDVLAMASNYQVTEWEKYHSGTWDEKGLGGKFTPLNIEPQAAMHGDGAYNSYLDKYVLVAYQNGGPIFITFSSDGLTWSDWQVVFEDTTRLNHYVSIISMEEDNEVTGQSFWVYFRWMRNDLPEAFDWARVKVSLE